jgi:hypothetical protein
MWRTHRVDIAPELRARFEFYGEDVLAHAVGAGDLSSKGDELNKLLQQHRLKIVEWLQGRRESRKRRDRLMFWILILTFLAALAAAIEPFIIHP